MQVVNKYFPKDKEYRLDVLLKVHKQAMRFIHGLSDRRRSLRGFASIQYFFSMESNIDDKNARFKIYLNLDFPENISITANYHIRVPSASYSKHCHHFFSKSSKRGDEVFRRCQVFETKNKFVDGAFCNIKINGYLKVKETTVNIPFIFKPDYCIFVDGQKIEVHKSFIQKVLPNFYSTFNLERNKHHVTNFSFMIIKAACGFCYNQPLLSSLFSGALIELIKFSETYKNEDLKSMAEFALCKKITNSNVIELANFTDVFTLPKLRKQTLVYLQRHLNEETMEFKALSNSLKLEMAKLDSDI
uniref:BTB domain-containing protein n=1 Tax=Panagrolaimus davidi TaxID=227884 RepID=A0A914R6B7_9BILA